MAIVLTGLLAGSCEEPVAAPPSTAPVPGAFRPPAFTKGQLSTLAILSGERRAHLAVVPSGKAYFCQPTDDGRDLVMTIGQREVPEPTALTSSTIADAIGDPLIHGNITSLSPAGNERLWFFFRGASGEGRTRTTILAVGDYDPMTTRIRIFADYQRLLAASDFGAAIEVADADVICTESRCWIWLRHLDGSVLLNIDLSRLPADGLAPLNRPFTQVRHGSEILAMNRPECRVSGAGDGDDLLLTDAYTGGLFRIDPLGRASLISTLVGLPRGLSPAAALPEPNRGRFLIFAPEDPPIEPKVATRIDAPPLDVGFPAFLVFEADQRIAPIGHRALRARPGMPLYAMRIDALVPEPAGTFLAFDSANGELLRVRLHN